MLFKMAPVFPEKLPYNDLCTNSRTKKKQTQEEKQFTVFNYFTSSTKLMTWKLNYTNDLFLPLLFSLALLFNLLYTHVILE